MENPRVEYIFGSPTRAEKISDRKNMSTEEKLNPTLNPPLFESTFHFIKKYYNKLI